MITSNATLKGGSIPVEPFRLMVVGCLLFASIATKRMMEEMIQGGATG
ncbi:MAG: hypothetical protein H7Y42_07790 [Chitinophagaceae bacterium]|nr:hypothetical protein [Chitinophagaceae bacterium]